jgi:hypothetical protein
MGHRVHRVLAVADWSVDPEVVAEALRAHERRQAAIYGLLVPARLGALDWVGDPDAARPCAARQLTRLAHLAATSGVRIAAAKVGDPEPVPAVDDALADFPADEILVFERERRLRLAHPLSLVRRLARRTGLAVERVVVPSAESHDAADRLPGRRAPHCAVPAA